MNLDAGAGTLNSRMSVRAWTRELQIVGLLLTAWLAHLLAYVVIVPPWQHYDEPTHFEYAALIRELGRLPSHDEHIPALRRAIASSMVESGFYRNPIIPINPPDLNAPNLSLGINERGHPPAYYAVVALATTPFRNAPIVVQLYIARLTGVAFALLLFGAAYLVVRLLFEDWRLRCLVLAMLALQPAFADNLSSMNNDALANLVAVIILLASIWFVQRPGWRRFLPGIAALVLAVMVKRTLLIYGLLLPVAWLAALPCLWRRLLMLAAAGVLVAGAIWLLLVPWPLADWSGSAASTRSYISTRPVQRLHRQAAGVPPQGAPPYHGTVAIALATTPGEPAAALTQALFETQLARVAGQQLTLAAWMRADRAGLPAEAPVLQINDQVITRHVRLDTSWQLVTLTATAPPKVHTLAVHLHGPLEPGVAMYDALALVIGGGDQLPAPGEPDSSFEADLVSAGPPRNLLRNASAEWQIPLLVDPAQPTRIPFLEPYSLPHILSKTFNLEWIAAVYPRQALLLFQSAWGVFGWGEVGMSTGWFVPLGLLVIASVPGAVRFTWRARWPGRTEPCWQARAWWVCLGGVVLGWGAALLRVNNQTFPGELLWSFGRYTFVAMLPSMIVFAIGLREIFPPALRRQGLVGILGFLVLFALFALFGTVLPAARALAHG